MKILFLIPAFNERENIAILSDKIISAAESLKLNYKILFIIQGDDGSRQVIEDIKKNNPRLDFRYFEKPLGIGYAYKEGFRLSDGEFSHIVTMDADLNHDPQMLKIFLDAMDKNDADIVIGSRYIKGGKFDDRRIWKRIISRITNTVLIGITKPGVHDISSGYRLIKGSVISSLVRELQEKGYPSYMELMLKAKNRGYKITEVPIRYNPRVFGKSKMGKIRTFLDYLFFIPRAVFISALIF